MTDSEKTISWDDFTKVEMRVGTVIGAEVFSEARKPAYKLKIDFGTFGILRSSAQVTKRYQPSGLIGKQVVAVVNFPEKQIGPFMSQCLILGAVEEDLVTLLHPGMPVANGTRIG